MGIYATTYINSHNQSIICKDRGVQDGDQYPLTFYIECEGEAGADSLWVEDMSAFSSFR